MLMDPLLVRRQRGAQFVQAIGIPAPGLDAPRQILHIATGVGRFTAASGDLTRSEVCHIRSENEGKL